MGLLAPPTGDAGQGQGVADGSGLAVSIGQGQGAAGGFSGADVGQAVLAELLEALLEAAAAITAVLQDVSKYLRPNISSEPGPRARPVVAAHCLAWMGGAGLRLSAGVAPPLS